MMKHLGRHWCRRPFNRHLAGLPALLILVLSFPAAAQPPPLALFAPLDLGDSIPVSVTFLDDSEAGIEAADTELAFWALGDWSRALDGRLRFHRVDTETEALLRVRFMPPGEGQYGEMQPLVLRGKRGAVVNIRADTSALGPDIAGQAADDPLFRDSIVYLTCVHELGHALGLEHTGDYRDIMFFFGFGGDIVEYFSRYRRQLDTRDSIAGTSVLSVADRNRVRLLYRLDAVREKAE